MNIEKYKTGGKSVTLYLAEKKDLPLVVLNTYTGDGASVVKAMEEIRVPDCNLLVVGDLNWDHDMTP